MTMPQYVTNVTSFKDAVKILKNKSILNENVRYTPETEGMLDQMAQEAGSFGDAVAALEDYGVESKQARYIASQFFNEKLDAKDTGEIDSLIQKYSDEQAGEEAVMSQFDPMEEELNEAKKKEAKAELHPNKIHPQELRMGIRVELEHTDDLDKAKKIALDHLAENPFYYTALKLSGIESPSAPKAKAPKEAKAKKKSDKIELVDLVNQMQKVKMPKAEDKKKLKEARFNVIGEPNEVAKQVMQFVNGNATLKALSDDIEIQQTSNPNEALLRFQYWDALPSEAIEKLKLQFDVQPDSDFDEDTGNIVFYRLTPLRRNYGGKDLGASFEKFKSSLEEIVREVVNETFDGRDNLINPLSAEEENN
jgi:hypothetical protein